MKPTILILLVMLVTACSQKSPTIEQQNNRFANKFYPAKIDSNYVKGDISKQKYPIIFLLGGYEGGWKEDAHVHKLQKLGYHIVSIAFYDKAGFSNNLANINIDEIKKIMDSYKRYSSVDASSVGIIGQGKGAELALLMASYYPDIKMVVGMSTPHVSFQSSRATLATEPSWIYKGEEVPYVAYPKLSLTSIQTVFRLMRRKVNDFRDIHEVALKDKEAVEKARIKVENINGDIFLVSLKSDGMWNSVFMGEEIVKRLKNKGFKHNYEHKSYKGNWFLSREKSEEKKAWNDIYGFIVKSFNLEYTRNIFSSIDRDGDKGISLKEYLSDREKEEDKRRKNLMDRMFSRCDINHNYKIDYSEARMSIIVDKNNSYYNSDAIDPNYVYLPSVNHACIVSQSDFKEYDLNSDKSVSFDEFSRPLKMKRVQHVVNEEVLTTMIINNAKDRVKQCDNNSDQKIDKKEAMLETCHIDESVFTIADKNKNDFISIDELASLPAKYARFRYSFYLPSKDDKVVYTPYHAKIPETYELLSESIEKCDNNYDKKLDKSEATAEKCGFTEKEFLEADANKDGVFEYKDADLMQESEFFHEVDVDSSGKLDFDEWVEVF